MAINGNFNWGQYQPDFGMGGGTGLGGLQGQTFSLPGATAAPQEGFLGGAFGKNGWGVDALGAFNGLAQSYIGLKQLGLGKDALNFQKQSFDTNLANQAKLANASLEDQYRARVQAAGNNPTFNGPNLNEYMKQNSVSGTRGG